MQFRTVDPEKLRGIVDKVFGLTKEIFGEVVGNERWQKEGEAQQAKGTEKLKALREELERQSARATELTDRLRRAAAQSAARAAQDASASPEARPGTDQADP